MGFWTLGVLWFWLLSARWSMALPNIGKPWFNLTFELFVCVQIILKCLFWDGFLDFLVTEDAKTQCMVGSRQLRLSMTPSLDRKKTRERQSSVQISRFGFVFKLLHVYLYLCSDVFMCILFFFISSFLFFCSIVFLLCFFLCLCLCLCCVCVRVDNNSPDYQWHHQWQGKRLKLQISISVKRERRENWSKLYWKMFG